jgi:5-methyltetrahydropteroyltriglutamate--homocysteine methyltransferase
LSESIRTTHVGSLPRPRAVVEALLENEAGTVVDRTAYDRLMAGAVNEVVRKQAEVGIDIVSDGEISKISYATYIRHRLTGFELGEVPRAVPADLDDFPDYRDRIAARGETPVYKRPICRGDVAVSDLSSVHADIANLEAAVRTAGVASAFLTAASPGVIAVFQPNEHYATHSAYLYALADAMKAEYEAIAASSLLLQVDCPDLAMGRHIKYRDETEDRFLRHAEEQVEVLNHATAGISPDRMRMHLCWGNYEGPHTHDIGLNRIVDVVMRARPAYVSFEAANPRHAHEWEFWADARIPEDKVLMPGVIDTCTNYVEHRRLVAQRLDRFVSIVGADRVIGGTDCGFGTFAGFGRVEPDICWAKLGALVEGADLASSRG